MSEPFLGEIKMVGFNFAPRNWALCDGQILPINQNQSLYSILGTTYGGDGRTSFALPDLRGRVPVHFGNGFTLGQRSGEQNHTLTLPELPSHDHTMRASSDNPTSPVPTNNVLANSTPNEVYGDAANLVALKATAVGNAGATQSHLNEQPYTVLHFCICLQGLFPSRN